ncbi:MAG TPA: hypothetical protein VFK05_24385, partial [Polyangiaceae bacterium]|nr:hypothetical protein [Polyangiaceae bacterium]
TETTNHDRYVRALAASKRARWDLERDVLQGRKLESGEKFLPDGLSKVQELVFLSAEQRRFLGQIQGRTYANIFGLVERYINAKMLDVGARHRLGDQTALEALVRFSDEELKHQEMFRRIEAQCAAVMPAGYDFGPQPNEVAAVVLSKSTWAVLALTCHIELFTLTHFTESIEPDLQLSALFKDVLRFHWKEESQHAVLDELEWLAEDATLGPEQRANAVTDLIDLVGAVDGILQAQANADATYFLACAGARYTTEQEAQIRETVLRAYRYQYIGSGVRGTRFSRILQGLLPGAQFERVLTALAPLL